MESSKLINELRFIIKEQLPMSTEIMEYEEVYLKGVFDALTTILIHHNREPKDTVETVVKNILDNYKKAYNLND